MGNKHKLIEVISRLGVQALCQHVGEAKTERLNRLGLTINSSILAEILVSEHGMNVFRDKNLRLDILISQDKSKLKELLASQKNLRELLIEFNEFAWGENSKSKKILNILDLDGDLIERVKSNIEAVTSVEAYSQLHAYQNFLRRKVVAFLLGHDKNRVIVHMPTGSGKTRTTLEAVCDYIRFSGISNISIVWFAHSEELCEQAAEAFINLWKRLGSEEAQVVRMWGGSNIKEIIVNKPTFVVTSFQTAYKLLKSKDDRRFEVFTRIRSHCSLLIVDEAHQTTAITYQQAIELFSNHKTKIIGLTATPGRHHINSDPAESHALSVFYQRNKLDIVDDNGNTLEDPMEFLTSKGVLSKITRYQLNSGAKIELTESERRHIETLLDIPRSVLDKLGKDEKRTNLIATHALKLAVEKKSPTIIFAPSKDNAVELASLIKLKGCNAAAITGETYSTDRSEAIAKFKSGDIPILVNFGVLTTGFDAPNIKAVIIARPTTSVVLYSQMVGRGIRGPLMGGTETCDLVDVVDNIKNMPSANQAFTYFNNLYETNGG